MARNDQPDLFGTETQTDLFDEDAPAPEYRADPDKVRARLHKILAEARAAQTLPWEPTRVSLYRTIFPQMTLAARGRRRPVAIRIRDGNCAAGGGLSPFLLISINSTHAPAFLQGRRISH